MTVADTGPPVQVELRGRATLAVRRAAPRAGTSRPAGTFLLVHGLASNARTWDGVAAALAGLGYACVAVDARGHGASAATADGYDTSTAADDLAALLTALPPLSRPVVAAGQSWGGNVVLTLAAAHPGAVDAIALLDGGWLRVEGHATFEDFWRVAAPPQWGATTLADVEARLRRAHPDWPESGITGTLANLTTTADGHATNRLAREHHRSILESIYDGDPRLLYPRVRVPALLMPAGAGSRSAAHVDEALSGLDRAEIRRYDDADHDLHAQFPQRVAEDLAAFAREVGQP